MQALTRPYSQQADMWVSGWAFNLIFIQQKMLKGAISMWKVLFTNKCD
jgi:hypothetical protein